MQKKVIQIGNVKIGGRYPVAIQSMTNTDTRDAGKTVKQIRSLVAAGCEIVRVSIPDAAAAASFAKIREKVPNVPLVADIHFDHTLALAAVDAGADKIRINPGNLGGAKNLAAVVKKCAEKKIPIRVGVNAGSLEKNLTTKKVAAQLVESALKNIRGIERLGYKNLVVSAKSSSVPIAIAAYEKLHEKTNYPLHLGITEAGSLQTGQIRSATGLGALLSRGIGDTIRVSLSDKPEHEVRVAWQILKSLELRRGGVNVIACPTCGRTEVYLIPLVKKVEKAVEKIEADLTVAVMGCVVNGPGEAAHADLALIGGKKQFALAKKGKIIRAVPEKEALPELLKLIEEETGK